MQACSASADPLEPVGLRNPEHWFLPETADSLRGLHRALDTLESSPVRQLLHAAFLGAIRRCSRATTQQGRLFLDAETARTDALETFIRFSKRAIAGAAQLPLDRRSPGFVVLVRVDDDLAFFQSVLESTKLQINTLFFTFT